MNIVKNKVYLRYGYCSNLFKKIRRKANFVNSVVEILRKNIRGKREMMWWRDKER